ncbi:hypothetical protein M0812_00612 [Anaeramoeba flamelloides]|uniref:Uncharacterized protein n=1 Tax=Anaeramoeba flamelloides TaxID=1746091 RepID=A0AAV8A549_9EUKA|nr:hypothetical protein M0812_00612 [Anaeramoeba flamelloides]
MNKILELTRQLSENKDQESNLSKYQNYLVKKQSVENETDNKYGSSYEQDNQDKGVYKQDLEEQEDLFKSNQKYHYKQNYYQSKSDTFFSSLNKQFNLNLGSNINGNNELKDQLSNDQLKNVTYNLWNGQQEKDYSLDCLKRKIIEIKSNKLKLENKINRIKNKKIELENKSELNEQNYNSVMRGIEEIKMISKLLNDQAKISEKRSKKVAYLKKKLKELNKENKFKIKELDIDIKNENLSTKKLINDLSGSINKLEDQIKQLKGNSGNLNKHIDELNIHKNRIQKNIEENEKKIMEKENNINTTEELRNNNKKKTEELSTKYIQISTLKDNEENDFKEEIKVIQSHERNCQAELNQLINDTEKNHHEIMLLKNEINIKHLEQENSLKNIEELSFTYKNILEKFEIDKLNLEKKVRQISEESIKYKTKLDQKILIKKDILQKEKEKLNHYTKQLQTAIQIKNNTFTKINKKKDQISKLNSLISSSKTLLNERPVEIKIEINNKIEQLNKSFKIQNYNYDKEITEYRNQLKSIKKNKLLAKKQKKVKKKNFKRIVINKNQKNTFKLNNKKKTLKMNENSFLKKQLNTISRKQFFNKYEIENGIREFDEDI